MKMVCLDMEGVLTPEIWQHVADRTGIAGLRLTTRDVKDYRELMDRRVEICREHGVTLARIQELIAELPLLDGARAFLDRLRAKYPLVILSDTFQEFASHFMGLLGHPLLLCHNIAYNGSKGCLEYFIRQENSKAEAVKAFRALNYRVLAAGDSYNDIHMLKAADTAAFFRAPANIKQEFPGYEAFREYAELEDFVARNL